jgi:hypothetical protein
MSSRLSVRDFDLNASNAYTVVGTWKPNNKSVVAHVACRTAEQARRSAVLKVAFQIYDGKVPEGLDPMNEAIEAVSKDLLMVAVFPGHVRPLGVKQFQLYE